MKSRFCLIYSFWLEHHPLLPMLTSLQVVLTTKLVISSLIFKSVAVLGLARTGLIFTRIQERAQPGRLTPPGQTEQGIPYRVPSGWVPVGGAGRGELSSG